MGIIYYIYTAFCAISFFAGLMQLIVSFRKGKDKLFIVSAFYSSTIFLYYVFFILFPLPDALTFSSTWWLRIHLVLGQLIIISNITLLYYLFKSIQRISYLLFNSFIGSIAVIILIMPDSILFGDQSPIIYFFVSPGEKMPVLVNGFTLWRALKDIAVITFIAISFTLLIRKLRDVSFRTIAAIFSGLVLVLVAALYDQVVDLGIFPGIYIMPFFNFINYLILTMVTSLIFIEKAMINDQLIQQERKCLKIINEAEFIVVELDRMGHVVTANPYFYTLTGYRQEQVIGKDWFEFFIPPQDSFDVQSAFVEILEYEFHPKYINPILTSDKREIMVQWFNVRTLDSHGKISGSLSIGIDISEIGKGSEDLKTKLSEAEELAAKLSSNPALD